MHFIEKLLRYSSTTNSRSKIALDRGRQSQYIGESPSWFTAQDFDSCTRGFKSLLPSHRVTSSRHNRVDMDLIVQLLPMMTKVRLTAIW